MLITNTGFFMKHFISTIIGCLIFMSSFTTNAQDLENTLYLELKDGIYLCNPPFQKDVITLAIEKILNSLNNNYKLTFIITIPIWDIDGKIMMKKIYNNLLSYQNIDYGEFDIINKIKSSIYLKYIKMIPKEKFTFIDHNFELYKNKTIQNTYLIILSNTIFNDTLIKSYNFN